MCWFLTELRCARRRTPIPLGVTQRDTTGGSSPSRGAVSAHLPPAAAATFSFSGCLGRGLAWSIPTRRVSRLSESGRIMYRIVEPLRDASGARAQDWPQAKEHGCEVSPSRYAGVGCGWSEANLMLILSI